MPLQFPNVDPWQVILLEHVPSVLILCAADEVELGPEDVCETLVLEVEVAGFVEDEEDEEDVLEAPPALRYQFAEGSPRQVPTVTDLKPFEYMEART